MTKKHYFVLRSIDPIEIDAKYGFYVSSSVVLPPPNEMEKVESALLPRTKIADLTQQKHKEQRTFSYLDESKKDHYCVVTMIQHGEDRPIPDRTTIMCFWCRHGFETRPIGCPIQYVPDRVVKNYYSEITKDNYTLRESISSRQRMDHESVFETHNMEIQDRNYYVTDGVFCSFNCCLAFIHNQRQNPLYANSENLLTLLYMNVFGSSAQPILAAPSWRLLKAYGGLLTIEEYRKNFYNVDYKETDNIIMRPMGFLFEKQIRI